MENGAWDRLGSSTKDNTDGREGIGTAETNGASDDLMEIIGSLLPNSGKMQDVLFMECLHLAGLSQKQGFMAGFTFALEVMRTGRTGRQ